MVVQCYLFNVPPVGQDVVKNAIEALINRPNSVALVTKTGDRGAFCAQFYKTVDRKDLYAARKNLRIDGKAIVVLMNKQVLGETTAFVRDALLTVPDDDLLSNPGAMSFVDKDLMVSEGGVNVNVVGRTIISTKTFCNAAKFASSLRRAVFHGGSSDQPDVGDDDEELQSEECESDQELATLNKLESAMPDLSTPTPTLNSSNDFYGALFDDCYKVEVGHADLMSEKVDGIVLETNPDMTLRDERLERVLLTKTGAGYLAYRKNHRTKNGPLRSSACVVHKNDGYALPARYLLHLFVDLDAFRGAPSADGLIEQLVMSYQAALMTAARAPIKAVSIPMLATDFALESSAHAALGAIKDVIKQSESFRMPRLVRLVDADKYIARSFSDAFASAVDQYVEENVLDRVVGKPRHPILKAETDDDDDDKKLSTATGTSLPKVDATVAAAAARAAAEQDHPMPLMNQLLDAKHRNEQKPPSKPLSREEEARITTSRVKDILRELATWPDQLKCWACEKPLERIDRKSKSPRDESKQESCQLCHRPYHTECFDKAGGICNYCLSAMKIASDGRCEDQPAGGRMEVQVVDNADRSPPGFIDARGHIRITYVFGCGTKPDGRFYFGCTRTAYMPNNEDGQRVCRMLRAAFDRGLLFTVGSVGNGGCIGVIWGCVPHKISLIGGRQKWGYPDETYLTRTETLLKANFGIDASMLNLHKEEERQQG